MAATATTTTLVTPERILNCARQSATAPAFRDQFCTDFLAYGC